MKGLRTFCGLALFLGGVFCAQPITTALGLQPTDWRSAFVLWIILTPAVVYLDFVQRQRPVGSAVLTFWLTLVIAYGAWHAINAIVSDGIEAALGKRLYRCLILVASITASSILVKILLHKKKDGSQNARPG